jgi:hypothetical protein
MTAAAGTRPASMEDAVVAALRTHELALGSGALITIDARQMCDTLLPLKKTEQESTSNDDNASIS